LNASENNGEIRGKDIIQTDGAIIAGILILLTISSFSPFEFPNRSMFVSLIIPAIMLFSGSALYIIEKKSSYRKKICKGRVLLANRIHDILDDSQHFKCDVSYHLARSDF
jgi:hypothetical protein